MNDSTILVSEVFIIW